MDKQKGNMIFRNSLSFLVNLYVIAFHVSFHFLQIYISNIVKKYYRILSIYSTVLQNHFGL